jgi:ADP-heptose:LPS heptosyltransferase
LRQVSPASIAVFPFRDFRPGEHAAEYYARCLGLAPEPPQVFSSGDGMSWAQSTVADLRRPILALHAGSGSARKNWTGFEELTRVWRESGSVVEIRGPAETFRPVGADRQIEVSLGRVAALLRCVDVYVGNDSGITHLAAAVGQRGTAVYGDTDLPHWRPRSPSISVVTAAGAPCTSCAEPGICIHRMSVGAVLLSLRQALQT